MAKTLAALFILLFFISSCQKDLSSENNPTSPASPTADSNYIDTLYETMASGGITDTTGYYKYGYDALKRVISINWEWGDFQATYSDSGRIIYFYNGADTLPYKSATIATYDGRTVFDTLVSFYFYNITGVLTRDSSVEATQAFNTGMPPVYTKSKILNSYFYSAGLIVRHASEIPLLFPPQTPMVPVYYIDSTKINSASNPVSDVQYQAYNTPAGYSLVYTITATYDAKPSPHKKLNVAASHSPILSGPFYFAEDFTGQNNMQSCTVSSSWGTTEVTNYTNTYFPNGFLYKAEYNSAPFTDGWLYKYKTL